MSEHPLSGPIDPFPEDSLAGAHGGTHEHEEHPDPVHQEVETHVDPAVAEAVHHVRDRFGARGLRDLITLASYELEVAESAAAALRTADDPDAVDAAFAGYVNEGREGGGGTGPEDDGSR